MAEEKPEATAQEAEPKKLEPKVTTQEAGPCKVKLRVEVAAEKVSELIDKKYQELNAVVAIPGFRPGKAPRPLLERKLGKAILEDVRNDLLERSYAEARQAAALQVVGKPDLNPEAFPVEGGKAFQYEVTLDVMPKIEVTGYEGIEVARRKVDATDAEIDDGIRQMRDSRTVWVPLEEGTAQPEDQVIADFRLTCEGAKVDEAENVTLYLHPTIHLYGLPLEKLHEELAGRAPGETVETTVAFPADHAHQPLAGKEAKLTARLKSVKRRRVPEVDETFLKSFDMDSVDDLRQEVRRQILRQKEAQEEERLKDEVVAQIVRANDFAVPEIVARESGEELMRRARAQLLLRGVPEDQLETALEEHEERLRKAGVEAVKTVVVLDFIADQERIFATEEQVDEGVAQIAQQYGKWPHEIREELEEKGILASLRRELRMSLVRDELLKRSKVQSEGA